MPKKPKSWLVFSSLAFQIALVMYGAVLLGQLIDEKYQWPKPFGVLGCSLLGLLAILYLIQVQTKRLNK
jgi:F0F1-type ATP synthase assembly protein I